MSKTIIDEQPLRFQGSLEEDFPDMVFPLQKLMFECAFLGGRGGVTHDLYCRSRMTLQLASL